MTRRSRIWADGFSWVAACAWALGVLSGCSGSVERRSGGESGAQGCSYGGRQFDVGDSFPEGDGCNTCGCTEQGVACTQMACATGGVGGVGGAGGGGVGGGVMTGGTTGTGTCLYEGRWYAAGEGFPAVDGCNKCSCAANGAVSCTLLACPPPAGCIYEGRAYEFGASFPSSDGCNTCTCYEGGAVGCTTMACLCDPAAEWYREYVATSASQCALIDYVCPVNTTYFGNDCGCGCQQDRSCPQWFDCMDGSACDPVAIKEKCPYSGIAY